jgi:hypothetical protein
MGGSGEKENKERDQEKREGERETEQEREQERVTIPAPRYMGGSGEKGALRSSPSSSSSD